MFLKSRFKIILFVFLVQVFINVKYAHAYIDAGTGSYIFQLLIAGILGGLFFIKKIFRSAKYFFVGIFLSKSKKNLEKGEDSDAINK
jgi:hypothetical protein